MRRLLLPVTFLLILTSLSIGYLGCGDAVRQTAERGHEPWVFRSVLDQRPRMVTLALQDSLWAAYDTRTGALYRVWREGVDFEGAVYNSQHGPQPTSIGGAYLVSHFAEPWRVEVGGVAQTPQVRYRGHRVDDGRAVLAYDLVLADGTVIGVTESPEHVWQGDAVGLERVFMLDGVPEGTEVQLQVHLNSLRVDETQPGYMTDGTFSVTAGAGGPAVDGVLTLNPSVPTTLTAWFADAQAVRAAPPVAGNDEHPALALMETNHCSICHNQEVQTVGPAFRAIAERYPTTEETISLLSTKVIQGGSGVWGQQLMTAHPNIPAADVRTMVEYILSLDGETLEPVEEAPNPFAGLRPSIPLVTPESLQVDGHGLAVNIFRASEPITDFPEIAPGDQPVYAGVVPTLHTTEADHFAPFDERFYLTATGYIDIPTTTNYVFRLATDDGSRLIIDDRLVLDNGGLHGPTPKDGEVYLTEGRHPIRVDFFQSAGGVALSLQWIAYGGDDFEVIPPEAFTYDEADLRDTEPFVPEEPLVIGIPGDGQPLMEVHPSFIVETIRPDGFEPMVGGLDVTPDGRVWVSTWDAEGAVYVLSNIDAAMAANDPSQIDVKQVASGLAEPLGLKVVDGAVYVLQKQELTHLIDHDGDDVADEYRTVSTDWQVSTNFHEFAFGLLYRDGYFYATLATAILPGGASMQPQIPDRGKVARIDPKTGEVTFIAHGLRTPNGIGEGAFGELYIADNQGDWLPSSKIVHLEEGAFYGGRSVDPEGTAELEVTPPVVWLPQDEIGNSPSQPAPLDLGPYAGQQVHGEVTHGGLKRVFVERVPVGEDTVYQGAVFRFTQGLEAGVNRVVAGPDEKLYVGGIGNPGNWGHYGKRWYGLQRLTYTGAPAFEMLTVEAKANGMEITFTESLPEGEGFDAAEYLVQQWRYVPTADYGGPKVDLETLDISDVRVSEDRRRVFLALDDLQPGHVVYLRLLEPWVSASGQGLWTTEAWYTLNVIPDAPGPSFDRFAAATTAAPNTLTDAEREAGWELLFDGETLAGWRGFQREDAPSNWRAEDGTLAFVPGSGDGGDLLTEGAYGSFEFQLDWKIAPGGNSGIFYLVDEGAADAHWKIAPEMQVLDNTAHADANIRTHRAADLYDLVESGFDATRPVGEWNRARIVVRGDEIEHWLNGHRLLMIERGSAAWNELVAASKFAEFPAFGAAARGHIALQDHGDRVWYRTIKIRPLKVGS